MKRMDRSQSTKVRKEKFARSGSKLVDKDKACACHLDLERCSWIKEPHMIAVL